MGFTVILGTCDQHPDLFEQAVRLRHRFICEKKGWLPISADGRDVDEYDARSTCIFVVNEMQNVVGFVRITPGNTLRDFMLGNDFRSMLSWRTFERFRLYLRKRFTKCAEVTRLVVELKLPTGTKIRILRRLFQAVEEYCLQIGRPFLIITVEPVVKDALVRAGYAMAILEQNVKDPSFSGLIDLNATKALRRRTTAPTAPPPMLAEAV